MSGKIKTHILLVAINIAMLIVIKFLSLFGCDALPYTILPSGMAAATKPWTIVTYMFVHINFLHMLFNMLWLYTFGRLLHDIHGGRKVVAAYIIGGIAGGLAFVTAGCMASGFHRLLGSSAAVLGVMTTVTVLAPNHNLNLLFIGITKLKWVYVFSIGLFVICGLFTEGALAQNIAHIFGIVGGAAYAFAIRFKHKPSSDCYKNSNKKNQNLQAELDVILDKVRRSGYASLTAAERHRLMELSKKIQNI